MDIELIVLLTLFIQFFLVFWTTYLYSQHRKMYHDLAKLAEQLAEFAKTTGLTIKELADNTNTLSALYARRKK